MKKVMFISILLISILFISSCELFVPASRSPQFSEDINMPFELPIPIFVKFFNRIDCSEIAPPYGGGCTSGVPGERSSITCDEGTPYCSSGNTCTIPDSMCVYLEDETSCHCQDEPPEPFCGDGQINQPSEQCDCGQNGCTPQELNYQTCENRGYIGGVLSCTGGCLFDESGCYNCVPDGCNGNCPAGCTVVEDQDCACVNNNGCCGIGCTYDNDNDCDPVSHVCGNGVVEPGSVEQCDIDVNSYVTFSGSYHTYELGNFQTYDFSGVCPTSEPCAACMACDMDISLDSQTCQCTDSRGHIGDQNKIEYPYLNDVGSEEIGEVPEDLCEFYNEAQCLANGPECVWADEFCGGGWCDCFYGPPGCCEDMDCCYDWGCDWIPAKCWVNDDVQDYVGSWMNPSFVLRDEIAWAVYEGILPAGLGDWTPYFIPNDLGGKYYDEEGNLVKDLTGMQDYATG